MLANQPPSLLDREPATPRLTIVTTAIPVAVLERWRYRRSPRGARLRPRPLATAGLLVLSDLLATVLVAGAVVLLRHSLGGQFDLRLYAQLWPLLGLVVLCLAGAKLYTLPRLGPAEEIKRLTLVLLALYAGLGIAMFLWRQQLFYSRAIYLISCPLIILAMLSARTLVRSLCSARSWWGVPVLVVGCGPTGRRLVRKMLVEPELGLKPIGILEDRPWRRGHYMGVPLLGATARVRDVARQIPALRVFVVSADVEPQRLRALFDREQQYLSHLLVIPDVHGLASVGVETHDLNGILSLHVRHRLLDPRRALLKRVLDLLLFVLILPLTLPLLLVLALLVRLDSPGPVFFAQTRVGRHGARFRLWKLRTMVPDAAARLQTHLRVQPGAAAQWEKKQKIKGDPRITRIGRFLRRTSLDELPQVWNILRGEMSFVGPRPILESEIVRYGEHYIFHTHVSPGLTGLWQISGRNNLSYPERVELDVHYVRNWSIWFDLHILLHTLPTILTGRGAY